MLPNTFEDTFSDVVQVVNNEPKHVGIVFLVKFVFFDDCTLCFKCLNFMTLLTLTFISHNRQIVYAHLLNHFYQKHIFEFTVRMVKLIWQLFYYLLCTLVTSTFQN